MLVGASTHFHGLFNLRALACDDSARGRSALYNISTTSIPHGCPSTCRIDKSSRFLVTVGPPPTTFLRLTTFESRQVMIRHHAPVHGSCRLEQAISSCSQAILPSHTWRAANTESHTVCGSGDSQSRLQLQTVQGVWGYFCRVCPDQRAQHARTTSVCTSTLNPLCMEEYVYVCMYVVIIYREV